MQVQNTTNSYVGFSARMNAGAKISGVDAHGNKITKDAPVEITTIRIPPLATVELDDKIWTAALKGSAKRQGIEIVKEKVQIGSSKEAEHVLEMTVPYGDGKKRAYNPVKELLTLGILKVVSAPKNEMTVEELRAAIEAEQGYALPKEVDHDKLVSMYERICA